MLLEGRVAIVTGAGTGIGKALCIGMAREGAKIAVVYRSSKTGADDTVARIEAEGGTAVAVKCDVAKPEDIFGMTEEVYRIFGRIDILINNAAERGPALLLEEACTEENWDYTMDVNVKSAFVAIKAVAPIMIKQKYGKIINITSIQGYRPGMKNRIAYQTSKTALESFTLAASAELAPHNITVNAMAPGSINTSIGGHTLSDEYIRQRDRWIPQRRGGEVDECLGSILFLASDMSSYVSGQSFLVDGGWACND